jgi:MFS family permease
VVVWLDFGTFWHISFSVSTFKAICRLHASILRLVRGEYRKFFRFPKTHGLSETFSFSATVSNLLVGLAIKCTYRYRIYSLIGVPTYIVGLLLTTFFRGPTNPLVYVLFRQIVTGIGGGMFHVPVQLGIQAVAKHQEVAIATAMFLTFTSLGGSVGSAIAGAIWTGYLPECLEYYLPNMPAAERQRIFNDFEFAMSFPRGSPERDGIVSAYVDVMKRLTRTATLSALPMLIFVFAMKEVKLDRSKRTRGSVDSAAIDDEEDEEVLGHESTSRRQSQSRASISQRRPLGTSAE